MKKTYLLLCFLLSSFLIFGQNDRDLIHHIDELNTSALNHFNNNRISESFNEFNKAKALADSLQDIYGLAVSNYNLGNIYRLMQNEESAKGSYNNMLEAATKINDSELIGKAYLELGLLYMDKRIYTRSISYFEKGIQILSAKNDIYGDNNNPALKVLFDLRTHLALAYTHSDNLDYALITLLRNQDLLKDADVHLYSEAYLNYAFGVYYVKKKHFSNAEDRFRKTIELLDKDVEDKSLTLLSAVHKELSQIYAAQGMDEKAYTSILMYNQYRDQFINEEKVKEEIIAKSKFQIADYQFNADLADYQRMQQIEMTKKIKHINYIVIAILCLLFLSFVAMYFSYASKRKLAKVLKIRNKELEIATDKALKSSELKSKFISNVSHELRTPLYGVVGITSLLLNEKRTLSAQETKYLKSLKYSGDYLLSLVNDILQVNKMEAQKIELKNVSVNLESWAQHIVDSFQYRLQESNNKIIVSIDETIPEYIKCDKVRLSQVLINLVGNSIKFTESGNIHLRIKLIEKQGETVKLRFEVEDNGKGIPKEKFQVIFDNFSQLGNESNTNYQGTGLGLSITKNIIELFKSKIELESEVNKGTKFSFDIQFEIDDNHEEIRNLNGIRTKEELRLNKQYKVLIAEDNKINQIVTKNLLIKQNYACEIVNNGLEALEAMKSRDFDLILMDINMPVMDGTEATEAIRQFNNTIPIIALTAADIEEIREDYQNNGFNDIITKPFDNYEFFQTIAAHIQSSKRQDVKLVIAS